MRVRECQSYPVDNVALPALKPRFIVSYLTGEKQIADLQAAMTAAVEKVSGARAAQSRPVR